MTSRKLRILLVSHYFGEHRGGTEIVTGQLAGELARRSAFDVHWAASIDALVEREPATRVDGDGVTRHALPAWNGLEKRNGIPYPFLGPTGVLRLIRAVRAADLVHVHQFWFQPGLFAFVAAKAFRRPVVTTQHGALVGGRGKAILAAVWFMNHVLGRWVLRGSARVTFVSETVREYFEKLGFLRRTPIYLPNGLDTAVFRPRSAEERATIRERQALRRPTVLFVGRFIENKGLRILERLARRMPEYDWVFVGWGPLDPTGWGELSHVRVLRGYSGARLSEVYAGADLLVLPSFHEGFPLVIQEAMACGTPVLTNSETVRGCPPAADLIWHEAVTAGPETVETWERRIRALLASDEPARARTAVAERARKLWSWSKAADDYVRLYAEALR